MFIEMTMTHKTVDLSYNIFYYRCNQNKPLVNQQLLTSSIHVEANSRKCQSFNFVNYDLLVFSLLPFMKLVLIKE